MKTHLLVMVTFVLMILTPMLGNAQVRLYPNPTEGNNFNLTSVEIMTGVEIYNVLGEKVSEEQFCTFKKTIEVPDLPSGIYLIKIFTKGWESTTIKMIKR